MAGFFKKVAKRFTGEARAERKATRQANRLARKQAKYQSQADRDKIEQDGLSQRANIAAAAGWNPVSGFPDEQGKGTGVTVMDTVKQVGGGLLDRFLGGGGSSNDQASSGGGGSEAPKDNKMLLFGALGLGAVLLFMNKKK